MTSPKIRQRIEEIFGWAKVGGLRQTQLVGRAQVSTQALFAFAAYNLTRTVTLLGWRLSSAGV